MAYITQFFTWSTGNTITEARLNGNISSIVDGLDSGTKDINIAKLQIGGNDVIDSSQNLTITGDITSSSSTSAKPVWMIKNTNADANSSELQFYKLSASPADNDDVGQISFYGDDDNTNKTLYAQILAESPDVTDSSEDGKLTIYTMKAGSSTASLTITSGDITIGGSFTDGTAILDGSGAWTGITSLTVDDITINANTISSVGASSLTITATAGQNVSIEGVTFDGGAVAGIGSLTTDNSTAYSLGLHDGWFNLTAVVPTRSVSDDPTYEITFASVDLTGSLQAGMRMKFTQDGTVRYFIITRVALDGADTDVTLYGGTDYDVEDTAVDVISALSVATAKAPFGFPLDPAKWSEEFSDGADRDQASPANGTWYNPGNSLLSIPIGAWTGFYHANASWNDALGVDFAGRIFTTLSTANNSESDSKLTCASKIQTLVTDASFMEVTNFMNFQLTLATKASYYLNIKSDIGGDNLTLKGSDGDTVIKIVSAYL